MISVQTQEISGNPTKVLTFVYPSARSMNESRVKYRLQLRIQPPKIISRNLYVKKKPTQNPTLTVNLLSNLDDCKVFCDSKVITNLMLTFYLKRKTPW